jgi:predicted DNA-binding transcriptional regulator AlpA
MYADTQASTAPRPTEPAGNAVRPGLSIDAFCTRYDIGRSTFYDLVGTGNGPRFLRIGRRVVIPAECADAWERERLEAAAA